MELSQKKLTELLTESFIAGYFGDDEQRSEVVLEILDKNGMTKDLDTGMSEYRIFSIEELERLPISTKIIHSTLGEAEIDLEPHTKIKFAILSGVPYTIRMNQYPWNLPIKIKNDL